MQPSDIIATSQSLPNKSILRAFVNKYNFMQKKLLLLMLPDVVTSICQEYSSLPSPSFITVKNKKFLFHLIQWFCEDDPITVEQWLCLGERLCPPLHWGMKDHEPRGRKEGYSIKESDQSVVRFFHGRLLVQHCGYIFSVQKEDDQLSLLPYDSIKEDFFSKPVLTHYNMRDLLQSLERVKKQELKDCLYSIAEEEYCVEKKRFRIQLDGIRATCDQLEREYPNLTTATSLQLVDLAKSLQTSITRTGLWEFNKGQSSRRKTVHVYRPWKKSCKTPISL